jgi:hypothetical protein
MNFAPYFDAALPLPGIALEGSRYRRIDDVPYRAFAGLNASLLKAPTAANALHDLTVPREPSGALALGTVLHAAVLEPWKLAPDAWQTHFVECPTSGLNTKAAKACQAENPGKTMITAEILNDARACAQAIVWNDEAQRWLNPEGGRHLEASGLVFDRMRFGCWRKIRVDLLPRTANYMLDVKTTSRALGDFVGECWKFGYFLQAAWYLDTHKILTGIHLDYFVFVAVTTEAPFLSRVFICPNMQPGDPLYADSTLAKARARLGLDDKEQLGRVPVILNSMRQTIAAGEAGTQLTPGRLRTLWPGYEDETPAFTIL